MKSAESSILAAQDAPHETRQRQLSPPTSRFAQQTIKPLQARALYPLRRALLFANDVIERAADADGYCCAGSSDVAGNPFVLLRRAVGNEQNIRRDRSNPRNDIVFLINRR